MNAILEETGDGAYHGARGMGTHRGSQNKADMGDPDAKGGADLDGGCDQEGQAEVDQETVQEQAHHGQELREADSMDWMGHGAVKAEPQHGDACPVARDPSGYPRDPPGADGPNLAATSMSDAEGGGVDWAKREDAHGTVEAGSGAEGSANGVKREGGNEGAADGLKREGCQDGAHRDGPQPSGATEMRSAGSGEPSARGQDGAAVKGEGGEDQREVALKEEADEGRRRSGRFASVQPSEADEGEGGGKEDGEGNGMGAGGSAVARALALLPAGIMPPPPFSLCPITQDPLVPVGSRGEDLLLAPTQFDDLDNTDDEGAQVRRLFPHILFQGLCTSERVCV